jgi:hypothetical protein
MMKQVSYELTLDRAVTYQIKVPGQISESWSDWVGGMTITIESEGDGLPVTVLTGTLDQAALLGLLRRLYSVGLPLISVICVEYGSKGEGVK